jgi:hypothetical protein
MIVIENVTERLNAVTSSALACFNFIIEEGEEHIRATCGDNYGRLAA